MQTYRERLHLFDDGIRLRGGEDDGRARRLGRAGDRLLYIARVDAGLVSTLHISIHPFHHRWSVVSAPERAHPFGIAEWIPTPYTARQPRRIDESTKRIEFF